MNLFRNLATLTLTGAALSGSWTLPPTTLTWPGASQEASSSASHLPELHHSMQDSLLCHYTPVLKLI